MDMHATRSQYLEATEDLTETANYLRNAHPDVLGGYSGDSVRQMLDALRRTRSSLEDDDDEDQVYAWNNNSTCSRESVLSVFDSLLRLEKQKLSGGDGGGDGSGNGSWQNGACSVDCFEMYFDSLRFRLLAGSVKQRDSNAEEEEEAENHQLIDPRKPRRNNNSSAEEERHRVDDERRRRKPDTVVFNAKSIQKASHIMHYIGIAIVGLFAVQVFVKMYALGIEFFRQKMEVFDGIITLTSFAVDVVTLEGVSTKQSEETVAVLVVFLLWRVLRLANAILVAAKQRQEFRIKLQKRGRQRSDKKIEWLESDINCKKREIDMLVRLCLDKGATEEDLNICRPKNNFPKLDASAGLSSVASFSLGLSMSMRGASDDPSNSAGLRRMTTISGGGGGGGCGGGARKQSFQELFPVRPATTTPAGSSSHHHSSSSASVSPSSKKATRSAAAAAGRANPKPGPAAGESLQLLPSSLGAASPMGEISEERLTAASRGERRFETGSSVFVMLTETPSDSETEVVVCCRSTEVISRSEEEEEEDNHLLDSKSSQTIVVVDDATEPVEVNDREPAEVVGGDGCYDNSVCSPVSDIFISIADSCVVGNSVNNNNNNNNNNNSGSNVDNVGNLSQRVAVQRKRTANVPRKYWSLLRRHVIK